MSEWTNDPWHDKYFGKSAPEFYYEPRTEQECRAYIRKWENRVPKTGEEWCLKHNFELWKKKYDSKKELNHA